MSRIFKTDFQSINTTSKPLKIQNNNVSLEIHQIIKCKSCNAITASCGHSISSFATSLDITLTDQGQNFFKADMKKGLFNPEMSDIIFEIENEQIHANKGILSVRSPVFHKMFSNDFKEKKENVHKVNEFSKESFKELIRFIYTGEIEDLKSNVYELLQASDFYQIPSLKICCEKKLLEMIDDSTAHSIFQESHLFNCSEELKKKSFEQIKKIFEANNYKISDMMADDPDKIHELFAAKKKLEALII